MAQPYKVGFEPQAIEHLQNLKAHERTRVIAEIEKQLVYQPTVVTAHRKRLRGDALYPWQLSVGYLRVYYEVSDEPEKLVSVTAIGIKIGNQLWIGGQETIL